MPVSNAQKNVLSFDRQLLAIGGTSRVLLVRTTLGEVWVEKELLPKYQARAAYEKMIQNEFEILSTMNPSIAPKAIALIQKEVFHLKKTLVIKMEWVESCSLSLWLQRIEASSAPKRVDQAWRLLAQLTELYTHIHETENLIHGDVSPENILVDREGRLRLIDFSLSHREGESSGPLKAAGRDFYRAPEWNQLPSATKTTDVYAIGKIFEQALGASCGESERRVLDGLLLQRSLPQRAVFDFLDNQNTGLEVDPTLFSRAKPLGLVPTQHKARGLKWGRVWRSIAFGFLGLTLLSVRPTGKLEMNTWPPSRVYLEGRFLGESPLRYLELPAASYNLEIVFPHQSLSITRGFELGPSQELKFFEDLRKIDNLKGQ